MVAVGNNPITADAHPDHDTIATFRKRFLPELAGLFVQILVVARVMGVFKLGKVSLDGIKIKANASQHKAMSWDYANKLEEQLRREVQALFRRAEQADTEDDPEVDMRLMNWRAILPLASLMYSLTLGVSIVMLLPSAAAAELIDVLLLFLLGLAVTQLMLLHAGCHGSPGARTSVELLLQTFYARWFFGLTVGAGILLPVLLVWLAPGSSQALVVQVSWPASSAGVS